MNIGIQTWGSHGDFKPYLALAVGLQSAGHDVTLVATTLNDINYQSAAEQVNIKFRHIASPIFSTEEHYVNAHNAILCESNPLKQAKIILNLAFDPVLEPMFEAAEKLCEENDLVIGQSFLYPLSLAAEKHNVPRVSIMLAHNLIPIPSVPPGGVPYLGPVVNRGVWWLISKIIAWTLNPNFKIMREGAGLPPVSDPLNDCLISSKLHLFAVSQEFCPQTNKWPDEYKVCGFFNSPNISVEGEISKDLDNFIKFDDRPIVYMTFGSMAMPFLSDQIEIITLFQEAATQAGCRAIIQAENWRLCDVKSNKDVHFVDFAPHDLIFPHCELLVHHGGAGTCQSSVLSGIPSVIVSFTDEQLFWGNEFNRLGLAPKPLKRIKVTSKQIAGKINEALSNTDMKTKAIEISSRMKNENGVKEAVEIICKTFS